VIRGSKYYAGAESSSSQWCPGPLPAGVSGRRCWLADFGRYSTISVEKVQLVGGICLLVASKYKEICTHGIEMHDALLLHQDEYRGFKCSEPEYLIEIY
jgi:hypothetical protein